MGFSYLLYIDSMNFEQFGLTLTHNVTLLLMGIGLIFGRQLKLIEKLLKQKSE